MASMQPPDTPFDNDGAALDSVGATQSTQETQQATQLASQETPNSLDAHLWGFLIPCSPTLIRIDFSRVRPTYKIGRNPGPSFGNDLIFPGMKISNQHATISWDGQDKRTAAVMVLDMSSNGTFINGEKIGKGRFGVLREGNEIAFGTPQPQPGSTEDYRFIYRHLAAGPPTEGLYAHYDITEELGKGSFATVMKALCRESGKWFAVKMIAMNHVKAAAHMTTTTDASGNRSRPDPTITLQKEVKILERLKHPNICQLKEVFYEDDYINIVLEWVPGGDLLEYILARNGLSEDETRHITYQLCDALAYIHSQGIAHRDLKPENVLLTLDDPPQVKVADFGLAKATDSVTKLRTMCGTPSYLAPEVVSQHGDEGYQNVVDSWSMGVIVFSMMTSSSPFIEPSYTTDVKVKILERKIEWDPLININVSQECLHFVSRLLEENPENRMTLTDALEHEWFAQYHPTAPPVSQTRRDEIENRASVIRDVSMREPLSQSMSMNLDPPSSSAPLHIPGAFPSSQPIQRRRKVLDEAREKGEALEPTPEMIERAKLEQQREEEELYNRNSRPLKRKAEGSGKGKTSEDDEMVLAVVAAPRTTRATRKGKSNGVVEVPQMPAKATRGRGGRGRGGKDRHQDRVEQEVESTDGSPRLRRSTRQCSSKPGRR
ncbi:kinase-like domain-containing protein [Irpex rosettiformis]|uniref:Kinase-like domain-containing protein n=1 Tax=Irpex rosettiformis TaxID=378272 RepID=A0ACB8U1B2_9APHY|nr:kinase-like domain-containing protein [Irpex rosettiformis]